MQQAPVKIKTPTSFPTGVFEEKVMPRLQSDKNEFKLKKQTTLIPQASASDYLNPASASIAVDLDTGDVLYEKDSNKRLPIASLTKIMTAVVALDLANPDEYFTVSDYASQQVPTRIGVVPQEKK